MDMRSKLDGSSRARVTSRPHVPGTRKQCVRLLGRPTAATIPRSVDGPAEPSTARIDVRARALATDQAPPTPLAHIAHRSLEAPTDIEYDAVIIGSGMGGLATAAKMVEKGAKVVVLEKYILPGGSAGHFKREGYTFDVGSSMMFGFGDEGTTNLITRCLKAVGKSVETVLDPSQVIYHLPKSEAHPEGLHINVHREYDAFIADLVSKFPHEEAGIKAFYGDCWKIFNALNSIELKSLEEPRYLMTEFAKHPMECLTLAAYSTSNTGDLARKYIKDPTLLRFIDCECYIWSTVDANLTPIINAGMVFCDRHFGGINYPLGGVGVIAEQLAEGICELGGHFVYKANVKEIITEVKNGVSKATGVRLADGRVFKGKTVVSNATRWDTFENMLGEDQLPEPEKLFRKRYKKSPSFLSIHMGVNADFIPPNTDCHHILLDDWDKMEEARGTIFVSMPSLLDPSLAPEGRHIVHAFTPDWIDAWRDLTPDEYERKKEAIADQICDKLESILPGIKENIVYREVGTPRTHRRFLSRADGTYGPIPSRRPLGMLSMPLNRTAIDGLYCVGDSTFPGQGVNAVVFSGFGCAHRVLCDLGQEPTWPAVDKGFGGFLSYIRDRS